MRAPAGTSFSVHRIALAVLIGLGIPHALADSEEPNNRILIQLTLNGVPVLGSQELSAQLQGKSHSEREALLIRPLTVLAPGSEYEMSVFVTRAGDLAKSNYTASSQVIYETFGCLTIRGTSTLLAIGSLECSGPEMPSLWVVFLSARGVPLSHNEYLFRVSTR